ncbi:MAG: helix-turn-helix transcriptional regulator [Lachnospiraceae bacterium]|jgi:transcriptional regulator with XRE-family HTH domain|nr:helix-turn-helix transcriptional regulator [Lachnospiraceae bacterium]
MSLNKQIIKDRLKETFNGDTQDRIAEKINLSQSTVSKLLSGVQVPTTDQLFDISEKYGVSVDWLLGRTNKKTTETSDKLSYAGAVEDILELKGKGAIDITEAVIPYSEHENHLVIVDPLLQKLLKKGKALQDADTLSLQSWIENRLCVFKGKTILPKEVWKDPDVEQELTQAFDDEQDLLNLYDLTIKVNEEMLKQIKDK